MRRRDVFALEAHPGTEGRYRGRLEVTVGDATYRVAVPSSLFKPGHGHAAAPR